MECVIRIVVLKCLADNYIASTGTTGNGDIQEGDKEDNPP